MNILLVARNRNWLWLAEGKKVSGVGILEEYLGISSNPGLRQSRDQGTSDLRSSCVSR